MRQLKTLGTALIVALVLVTCADYTSFATTGKSFLLGKLNTSAKVTTFARTTSGPVLALHSKKTTNPPLTVNGRGKVANLNADLVDGLDSSLLANRTSVYSFYLNLNGVSEFSRQTATLPAGGYLVTANLELVGAPTSAGTRLLCYIQAYSPNQQIASVTEMNSSGVYSINLSGVVRNVSATKITLGCQGPMGNYKTVSDGPGQISVTRIGQLTMGTATAP